MASHSSDHTSADSWREHLLCRRYAAVHLSSVGVEALDGGTSSESIVVWAVGLTEGYQSEVLGAWMADASSRWGPVLDDLVLRGVERIGLAVVKAGAHLHESLHSRFPGAVVLPSFGELLNRSLQLIPSRHQEAMSVRLGMVPQAETHVEALSRLQAVEHGLRCASQGELFSEWHYAMEGGRQLWSLRPALRREVLSGDGTVAAISRTLRRSVARHGSFSDQESALAFVRQAVDRALRRRALRSDEAVTEHNHHRVGFSPRMTALGV